MHLRFRQIRYFVEIVDQGSMTRAAERLNLAPTALSLQMKKLEAQFDVVLLERHARGVSPTARGHEFYDYARRVLELLDETKVILSGNGASVPHYRLGVTPSMLHATGLRALGLCPHDGHDIVVELVEGCSANLMARLDAGDIDFALGWVSTHSPSIKVVDVAEESIVFVTSQRRDVPGGAIALDEALFSDLIQLGRQSMSWDLVCRRAAASGTQMGSVQVVESDDLVRRMLRDGLGTAILPIGFIDPERRSGVVDVYPIKGEPITRRLSFAWRESTGWEGLDSAVIAYVDNLISNFQSLTAPYSRVISRLTALSKACLLPTGSHND